MKNKFSIIFLVAVMFFGIGDFALAQGGNASSTTSNASSTSSAVEQINLNIQNPISSVNSIPQFFQKVLEFIIKIAIPFTAIVLVYCGLLFVTARGDSAQLEKAKNAFTFAVIGGLVLLSSWLIAQAIKDALTSLAYVF